MVKLSLIIEGGAPGDNVSADTANNSEALRESLHKFFRRLLNRDDIDIKLSMGYGCRNAAKQFINEKGKISLFVDSDFPPSETDSWFNNLINKEHPERSIVIPDDKKEYIFFMIQEMEAWFFKQPSCLEKWAEKEGYTKTDSTNIVDHSLLRNKNIEEIKKPSSKLKDIMKHFFKKGNKKAKYGKLKTAPSLLDELDVNELKTLDKELQRFYSSINN